MGRFGWDLPPGCSHRDIENAYGGGDVSPEAEEVCEILDVELNGITELAIQGNKNDEAVSDALKHIDTAETKISVIVENLVGERDYLVMLLHAAYRHVPEPICTCRRSTGEHEEWCAINPYDGPPLKEEIRVALKIKTPDTKSSN